MIFNKSIVKWYLANKRDLPWRDTQNPYKIWLSEIILQQTRVDQGMAYYLNFVHSYPTISDLAAASEDEILKKWQGLGYYSRARNLHATAKFISNNLNGEFPNNYEHIVKLKGVGAYTAAAIASFAYGEKTPVLDGNVMRVLSRFFGVEDAIDSRGGLLKLKALAEQNIDAQDPATYNQAIMEFGALQCTPKAPKCDECPLKNNCFAQKHQLVTSLPYKEKKTKVTSVTLDYMVLEREGTIYFKQRTQDGIWKGLYDFPSLEVQNHENGVELPTFVLKAFGKKSLPVLVEVSDNYTHLLSHRKITARFFHFELKNDANFSYEEGRFYAKNEWMDLGIPRLVERYMKDKGWYE